MAPGRIATKSKNFPKSRSNGQEIRKTNTKYVLDKPRWQQRNKHRSKVGTQQLQHLRTGNIKSRLTLDSTVPSHSRTLQKNNGQTIVKTVQQTGQRKEIKLFTKHFDARTKLSSKKTEPSKRRNKIEKVDISKGIAKKALEDVKPNRKRLASNKRQSTSVSVANKKNKNADERQSTFTGTSIQIKTKNHAVPNARETYVKGTGLSIVTSNVAAKHNAPNKRIHRVSSPVPIMSMNKSRQIPLMGTADVSAHTTVKKPMPAKMIISNLHPSVTQDDIKELFGAIGKLKDVRLKNIGTAEVTYADSDDAFEAYNKYNTRNLDGQPMILKITTVDEPTLSPAPISRSSSHLPLGHRTPQPAHYTRIPPQHHSMSKPPPPSLGVGNNGKPVVFTVRL